MTSVSPLKEQQRQRDTTEAIFEPIAGKTSSESTTLAILSTHCIKTFWPSFEKIEVGRFTSEMVDYITRQRVAHFDRRYSAMIQRGTQKRYGRRDVRQEKLIFG